MAKLLAEWFWTDRWMGSSAFLLPLEARGLYREMLTQAWRRGAKLPDCPDAIQRACGVSPDEWERAWPLVRGYWIAKDGELWNETQRLIYREALAKQKTYERRARKAAKTRWESDGNASSNGQELHVQCPPSPSSSLKRRRDGEGPPPLRGGVPPPSEDAAILERAVRVGCAKSLATELLGQDRDRFLAALKAVEDGKAESVKVAYFTTKGG